MNNRKRMIAKVYRRNPELILSVDAVANVISRITEAAQEISRTFVEAFNRSDWAEVQKAAKKACTKITEIHNTPAGE